MATIQNNVFWDVTTRNLVDSYQHFVGTCSFLLQTWRQCKQVPTKCQEVYTRLHDITSQKTVFFRCLKSPVLSASVRQYSVSLYTIISLYFSLQKTTMHTWNSHCQQSIHITTLKFSSKFFHILTPHELNNLKSKGQTFHCNNYAPVTKPDSENNFHILIVFSGNFGHYLFINRNWHSPVENTLC